MIWVVTLLLVGVALFCGVTVVAGAYLDEKRGEPGTAVAVFLTSAVWACVVVIVYLWSRP